MSKILKHLFVIIVLLSVIIIGKVSDISNNTTYYKYPYTHFNRELTVTEIHKLFLYKETTKYGLSYNDYTTMKTIIKRESEWNANARHINKNKTKDVGLFQINDIWGRYATKHNLNYKTNWKDNIILGIIIYKRYGIKKWVSMK